MYKLFTTNYIISSKFNKKIVMISDIHYYDKKMSSILNEVVSEIKTIHPSYICIPGDIIDERYICDKEIFIDFLNELSSISPVIVSIGNHEIKTKTDHESFYDKKLFKEIRKINNLYLLENESIELDEFSFTGLYFKEEAYKENKSSEEEIRKVIDKYFRNGIKSDKYKIVLSHSPFVLASVKDSKLYQNSDLILSGHTHAGITPIIFHKITKRVFVSPAKHILPKDSYGYLKKHKTIVSSGIIRLSHFNPFRKFNFLFKGEIVVIDL